MSLFFVIVGKYIFYFYFFKSDFQIHLAGQILLERGQFWPPGWQLLTTDVDPLMK